MTSPANPIINFIVRGEIFKDDKSLPVTIEGSYSQFGFDPVVCKVLPHEQLVRKDFWIEENGMHYLQLRGNVNSTDEIWIPRLRVEKSGREITGTAELFVQGNLGAFDSCEGQITAYFHVPYTPLLAEFPSDYDWHEDGTFDLPNHYTRQPITWKTPSAEEVEFNNSYSFHSSSIGADRTLIRVQECNLKMTLSPKKYQSLKSVIDDLWHNFDEALWLLSFLSKKYIPWYSAFIVYEFGDRHLVIEARRDQNLLQRKTETSEAHHPVDLLIKPEVLEKGVFERMISNYENSPYKDTILRLVQNLLITYEDNYIEAQIGLIYTAFEMLVHGMSDSQTTYIVGKPKFKKIKKRLEEVIRDKLELRVNESEYICEKLPELHRYTFKTRLPMVFKQHGIDIYKFWPPTVSQAKASEALEALIKRRNEYIHQGKIHDYRKSLADFHRIRLIIEIAILKILGYPLDEINEHSDDFYLTVGYKSKDHSFAITESNQE